MTRVIVWFGGDELSHRAVSGRAVDVSRSSSAAVVRGVIMIRRLLVSQYELDRLALCSDRELAN